MANDARVIFWDGWLGKKDSKRKREFLAEARLVGTDKGATHRMDEDKLNAEAWQRQQPCTLVNLIGYPLSGNTRTGFPARHAISGNMTPPTAYQWGSQLRTLATRP